MSEYGTPAPAVAAPNAGADDPTKKVQFRFCAECANLLYPDEDKSARQLLFTCKNCGYNEKATTACTYRNVLHNTASETAGVTADLAQDPTVSGAPSPISDGYGLDLRDENGDDVPAFCTMCGQEIFCEVCGEDHTDVGLFLQVNDPDQEMRDVDSEFSAARHEDRSFQAQPSPSTVLPERPKQPDTSEQRSA